MEEGVSKMRNDSSNVRMLVEAGVLIGLAYIMDMIRLFEMPQGGSVTLGSMIPILIFAIRWGAKPGIMAGLVFGSMQFLLGPKWSFHPLSILFDYVIAWGCLGFAGFFKGSMPKLMTGVAVAIFGRFVCHVISGVTIWSSYAPEGTNALVYSVGYNGTYLGVEALIAMVVFSGLYKPLKSYMVRQA